MSSTNKRCQTVFLANSPEHYMMLQPEFLARRIVATGRDLARLDDLDYFHRYLGKQAMEHMDEGQLLVHRDRLRAYSCQRRALVPNVDEDEILWLAFEAEVFVSERARKLRRFEKLTSMRNQLITWDGRSAAELWSVLSDYRRLAGILRADRREINDTLARIEERKTGWPGDRPDDDAIMAIDENGQCLVWIEENELGVLPLEKVMGAFSC